MNHGDLPDRGPKWPAEARKLHLLAALSNGGRSQSVAEAAQIYRLLTQANSNSSGAHRIREKGEEEEDGRENTLSRLQSVAEFVAHEWTPLADPILLPNTKSGGRQPKDSSRAAQAQAQSNGGFRCQCAQLDVEELRGLSRIEGQRGAATAAADVKLKVLQALEYQKLAKFDLTPTPSDQVSQFGAIGLERNALAKQLLVGAKFKNVAHIPRTSAISCHAAFERFKPAPSETSSLLLKLEQLIGQSEANLVSCLERMTHDQWIQTMRLWLSMQATAAKAAPAAGDNFPYEQWHLPSEQQRAIGRRRWNGERQRDKSKLSASESVDSGVVRDLTTTCLQQRPLLRHLELRSSKQVRALVNFSAILLSQLVQGSHLFHLNLTSDGNHLHLATITGPQEPPNLAQLKLLACVECEKMRARLRFEWLPGCLALICTEGATGVWPRKSTEQGDGINHNELELNERDYYDFLAHLMGRLLREEFVVQALDCWHAAVAAQLAQVLNGPSERERQLRLQAAACKLSLRVELVDEAALVELNKLDGALEEALGFVMQEIGRVSSGLPRLETQLQFQAPATGVTSEQSEIIALGAHDTLLAERRSQMARLLGAGGQQLACVLPADYLKIIDIVNAFRSGNSEAVAAAAASMALSGQQDEADERAFWRNNFDELSEGERADDRFKQLLASCQQIKLLAQCELSLATQLGRFFRLGNLLRLDCEPLRASLAKCIQKERLFLARFHADDAFKLVERLCLQFDEIELQIDLESAIEDFLNERWRTKQSQAPGAGHTLGQQVLLASLDSNRLDDLDDEDEPHHHDLLDLEPMSAQAVSSNAPSAHYESLEGDTTTGAFLRTAGDQPQQQQHLLTQEDEEEADQDEEFAIQLAGNRNASQSSVAHLFALGNPQGGASAAQLAGETRVAPLVECRLLVGRYQYLSHLLEPTEFGNLQRDLRLALANLNLMSEFFADHSELPTQSHEHLPFELGGQLETTCELAWRLKELKPMLANALERLQVAGRRLRDLNELRWLILAKLTIEFDRLMRKLGNRALGQLASEPSTSNGGDNQLIAGLTIKQLDAIQETSNWAQKLASRVVFLERQRHILAKESDLLMKAKLFKTTSSGLSEDGRDSRAEEEDANKEEAREATAVGHNIGLALNKWRPIIHLLANFWQLVDEFETQQVKWLNSDSKRIEYERVVTSATEFRKRLEELKQEASGASSVEESQSILRIVILDNLAHFGRRLDEFGAVFLPTFKFLSNKQLTEEHWLELSRLINGGADQRPTLSALTHSSAALLLEAGAGRFGSELEAISRRATMEHELAQLIEAEVARSATAATAASDRRQLSNHAYELEASGRLEAWSAQELCLAAGRFVGAKLTAAAHAQSQGEKGEPPIALATGHFPWQELGRQLFECHAIVRRFLKLSSDLNLIHRWSPSVYWATTNHKRGGQRTTGGPTTTIQIVRSHARLTSERQLRVAPAFIEFLRLTTEMLLEEHSRIGQRVSQLSVELAKVTGHLGDIETLLREVSQLNETGLREASHAADESLARLERARWQLELKREILATNEALALERQRDALKARDHCVRLIAERAVPAIRAAARPLDCLGDGRALGALRSLRPEPPLPVRLVIEAVCLLRNSAVISQQQTGNRSLLAPQHRRHLDSRTGKLVEEDYWPHAWRTLNGLHSSRFLSDLRRVDKKTIPEGVMTMIRRRYLTRPEFNLTKIQRVSPECALLAKWLIAVDIFDRVINVARPNYAAYLRAEQNLGQLFIAVEEQRNSIETIEVQLDQMESNIGQQIARRASLADMLRDCGKQSSRVAKTRIELQKKRRSMELKLNRLEKKRRKLINRCLWRAAKLVYIEALPQADQNSAARLILRSILGENDKWLQQQQPKSRGGQTSIDS